MSHFITVVKILQSQDLFCHIGETFMCTCYTQRLCSYVGPDECVQRTNTIVANLANCKVHGKSPEFVFIFPKSPNVNKSAPFDLLFVQM